jgi:hypothetical protein
MIDTNDYTFRIYLVRSPSNKVYVGYTGKSLEARRAGHEHDSVRSNLPFHKAIRKYGSSMEWKVLIDSVTTIEEAHKLEKSTILEYESYKRNKGYNCTFGGDGCSPTEEIKKKISEGVKASGINPGRLKQKPITVFRGGIKIDKYTDQIACAKALNLNARDISRCLCGRRKTYKGYTFKSEE